ncbi:MAG: helix-turn-helix domain-containing protein, partial [Cyclobacteriaceae bacterium]
MKYNKIKNPDKLASAIEQLLNSNEEAKLYKKLHTVLLVARHPENNCSEVARQLGYSPHTVARWVRTVCSDQGFALKELQGKKKPGRKKRLTSTQLSKIYNVLEKPPEESKNKTWTGKVLS